MINKGGRVEIAVGRSSVIRKKFNLDLFIRTRYFNGDLSDNQSAY